MNTDQARRLVTLHDNADRALANLRNANSMSTDDPRATELLEGAGDAYAEAMTALFTEQSELIANADDLPDAPEAQLPEGFEDGQGGLDRRRRGQEAPADAPSAADADNAGAGGGKAPDAA